MTKITASNRCDELVTVVALCYNQASFFKETLDSIMQQTWPPSHFYIIDDFSTDNSVEKIEEWLEANGNPATFIKHTENWGITRTMNQALSLCKTKYFQPWPCDDIMMPDKIESQVTYMESLDWQPGFLYGDIQWIDNNSNLLRESVVANRKKLFPDQKMPDGFIFAELVQHGCFIPTASGLYVTRVLTELGGFDEKLFAEDWDMFMRIALHSGIAYKEQVVSKYRRHSTSAEVSKGEKYWQGHFKILPKYLGVNQSYDNIIWDKIGRDALQATKDGIKNSWRWIWQSTIKTRNVKLLYLFFRIKLRIAFN